MEQRTDLPKILVGMPVLNRADRLPLTLQALTRLDYPKDLMRIIFVDGGSKDGTIEILRNFWIEYQPKYREIEIDQGGFEILPKARNDVLRKIRDEDYVWFLDSDVIVKNDSLHQLLALASKGFDYCNLYANDGSILYTSGVREVDTSMLACALISGDTVKRTGLFDERLVWLPEDSDYCLRAKKSGSKIAVDYSHYVNHQIEGRRSDFGWRRWTARQRRSAAFTMIKLVQYGILHFPQGRAWFRRLALYFVIFIATILSIFVTPLFLIPLAGYFLFQFYKSKKLIIAAMRTVVALSILPVTVFALVEVALELRSPKYRRWRNRKLLGVDMP